MALPNYVLQWFNKSKDTSGQIDSTVKSTSEYKYRHDIKIYIWL